jgi:dTDP-4-amino-4,6-dideoxygalactose transaminase
LETGKSNYHLFVITTSQRDKLRAYLAEHSIPTAIHYPVPLHRQPAFAEFNQHQCPNADQICSRILSLPMHAFLSDTDVGQVIEAICGFFNRRI